MPGVNVLDFSTILRWKIFIGFGFVEMDRREEDGTATDQAFE